MVAWQIWCLAGILLVILEMFTPALFFLNLAFSAFIVAAFTLLNISFIIQTIIFIIVSTAFISFLRPFIYTKIKPQSLQTGMEAKYIEHNATVVKEVTQNSGRIAIYGEEWNARCFSGTIPVGKIVKIKSYDNIIMTVEEIKE